MDLYQEVKRLLGLGQIGNVLSSLHAARASPNEEDLEEFYYASYRLLAEALSSRARRAKQYIDRLIDKAYRTIDRGGVKIVSGRPGLASRPRFERLLSVLERRPDDDCRTKALRSVVYYALYPKYKRLPGYSCPMPKYDGISKLVQCFVNGWRCLDAYRKLSEYTTIFTLRAALRAARIEQNPAIAERASKLLHLGTPADKAELSLIRASMDPSRKPAAEEALAELREYCRDDYAGKIHRALDFSRTCTRLPRLEELAREVLRRF